MPGYELFGAEERNEVNDVLETGILMRYGFDGARKGMWKSKELEETISKTLGCKYALLVSSGTAALTTALSALGVGAGDEVIMPTFTFVASFEAILSVGAIPVVADINETLTMDPASVRRLITSRTKCIMPVHMCGSMAEMDELLEICKEHNLILLEDACQSIGAKYKGRYLGTIGNAGTFSFDFVKTITCGEGGGVITNSQDVYTKAEGFSDHGHDHKGVDRGADLHPFTGYNYRISELHAAVGLAQFRKLDQFLAIQKRNHQQLKIILSQVPEISFRVIPDPAGDSCTFLSWFLPTEALMRAAIAEMKEQGIAAGNFYWYEHNWHYVGKWDHLKHAATLNPLHESQAKALNTIRGASYAISDQIMSRCVSTSISLLWTDEQVREKGRKMAEAINKVIAANSVTA